MNRSLWQTFATMILSAGLVLAGCGAETGGDDAPIDTGTGRYLPLSVGASWTWQVTPASGTPYQKTSTVEALEDVGDAKAGVMAYRVRTVGDDGQTLSWQQDTGSAIVRHREQSFTLDNTMTEDTFFDPYKLRIDEAGDHIESGVSFTESYTETGKQLLTGETKSLSKSETWTVEAIAEPVTVPAGTFNCLRIRRTGSEDGSAMKTFWYARGVGKVKEVGGQTEELASYSPGSP
jgi:hypothetical protein